MVPHRAGGTRRTALQVGYRGDDAKDKDRGEDRRKGDAALPMIDMQTSSLRWIRSGEIHRDSVNT